MITQVSFLKRRCHNNLNFTSPTSHFLHTSRGKTPFSSPRVAPRWPHIWPRCPQDSSKTGRDSPNTAGSTPTMVQESSLKSRCHNNPNFTSSTSHLLHTSQAKTPFSSFQDGPKTPQDGPQMAPSSAKMAPKWPKIAQDDPKMAQDSNLKRRRHSNIELTSSWDRF